MAFYLSPLVDVNEIDLSTTIPAVATSIGAIIVRDTYRGAELKQTLVTNKDELISAFGEPTTTSYDCNKDMLSAEAFLKYGNKLYVTRAMPVSATFAGGEVTGASYDWVATDSADALKLGDLTAEDPDEFHNEGLSGASMYFIAQSRGMWGNNVRISMMDKTTQSVMLTGGDVTSMTSGAWLEVDDRLELDTDFLIMVQYKAQGKVSYVTKEVFNVSTIELAIDDQGATKFCENVINENSKYIRMKLDSSMFSENLSAGLVDSTWMTFAGGIDNDGDIVDDDAIQDALDLYRNPEETDVNILIDSDKSEQIKRYMIIICEERKDCMAVLDCKSADVINQRGSEALNLREWRRGTGAGADLNENTSYAALYGNWFEVYNRYTKKYVWVPASGYVAGIYAKTDDVSDPWFAPAGLNRGIITGIRKLAWNPQQGHRDILYQAGINPIVSFAGQGKVIWGQKNLLDKSSAFNRVNVRRLFMVMEKAISTATKYFLFEPNDPATRRLLVNMIEPFLRDIKARRGVYDFKVVCDETINTPERIDRNELWCNIFIKPTRTAEFIVLNFIATKTGASFDELTDVV